MCLYGIHRYEYAMSIVYKKRFCTATEICQKRKGRISLYSISLTEYAIVFVTVFGYLFSLFCSWNSSIIFLSVVTAYRPSYFSMVKCLHLQVRVILNLMATLSTLHFVCLTLFPHMCIRQCHSSYDNEQV